MLENKTFEYESFAAKGFPESALVDERGAEELNKLSEAGWEAMTITVFPGYGSVAFLQATDVPWEYMIHSDTRNVGLKGFVFHDARRETIIRDLQAKNEDTWRLFSIIENRSGLLSFIFKRPVQEEATAGNS